MSILTKAAVISSSDTELFALLGKELETRITTKRGSPEFVAEIRKLPVGLRAMAATYELDVSLAMDDLGWHFGNWHNPALTDETSCGLKELGMTDLAEVFDAASELAGKYWDELGAENWSQWYHGSALEQAMEPFNQRAWAIQKDQNGILDSWVYYARKHPERVSTEK
jgi:hypothetical protein